MEKLDFSLHAEDPPRDEELFSNECLVQGVILWSLFWVTNYLQEILLRSLQILSAATSQYFKKHILLGLYATEVLKCRGPGTPSEHFTQVMDPNRRKIYMQFCIQFQKVQGVLGKTLPW